MWSLERCGEKEIPKRKSTPLVLPRRQPAASMAGQVLRRICVALGAVSMLSSTVARRHEILARVRQTISILVGLF